MNTKLRILKEAGTMFSKYGIRNITMEHIANELGISKKTIYEKFSNKDDLISQIIENGAKAHKKQCSEIIDKSNNIIEAVLQIARINDNLFSKINPLFFEDLKKYHPEICAKITQKGSIKDYTIIDSLLKNGVKEGIIKDNINIELVNIYLHKIMDLVKTNDFGDDLDKEDIKNSIFIPYLMGIATEEGRKLIDKYFK